MSNSIFELVIGEISSALAPLIKLKAVGSDGSVDVERCSKNVEKLLSDLGYKPPSIGVYADIAVGLTSAVKAVTDILDRLKNDLNSDLIDLAKDIFPILKDVFPAIKKVAEDFKNGTFEDTNAKMDLFFNQTNFEETFPRRLLDFLIVTHLKRSYPKIYSVLMLTGFALANDQEEDTDEFRSKCILQVVNWEAVPMLFQDPLSIPASVYDFGGNFNAERFMAYLEQFIRSFGLPGGLYPLDNSVSEKLLTAGQNASGTVGLANKEMRIPLYTSGDWLQGDYSALNLCIAPIKDVINTEPQTYKGFGAYFTGSLAETFELGKSWRLGVAADMQKPILVKVLPEQVAVEVLTDDNSSFSGKLAAKLVYQREEPTTLIGFADTLSIGFDGLSLTAGVAKSTEGIDYLVEADVIGLFVQIKSGDGDSFLQKILPSEIKVSFDLGFGYSKAKKFYIKCGTEGQGGELNYTWQLNKELGPVLIREIIFALKSGDNKIKASASVCAKAELGPVTFLVEKVGLSIVADMDRPGILGKADMYVDFKLPEAVGINIEASAVTGGGYLAINDTGYEGIIHISVSGKFSVTAIGILTTKPADGGDYFSLKIIGNVLFPPIQLGFGFFLCGVGIAAAINSEINVTALQNSVRNGSISSILFPPDPIKNAPRIINDIKTLLPASEGNHVFGVMVKIGWGGAVAILDGELGIFLQVGKNFKIAVMGIIRAVLPNPESAVVSLQLAVVGILDLETETISIDASLFSSKILTWPISGDMALRLYYGDNAYFAMSVGGFYPGYRTPGGFPELRRLSICFGEDNPKILLGSYFAITDNSVQFGAGVEFFFQKDFGGIIGNIKLEGAGGFDALILFKPKFYFECGLYIRLNLSRNDKKLLFLSLDSHFSGPNVFHLYGSCTIDIAGIFSKEISFDEYFGDEVPEQQSPRISAFNMLREEVRNNSNWVPLGLTETETLVSFRYGDDAKQLVNTEGGIRFSQGLLPLEREIEKLGESEISEGKAFFSIEPVVPGAELQEVTSQDGNFAPGMYRYLSDSEKLSGPAFVKMPSGFAVSATRISIPSKLEQITFDFEIIPIIDEDDRVVTQTFKSVTLLRNRNGYKAVRPNDRIVSEMSEYAGLLRKGIHDIRRPIREKGTGKYRVNYY
ncbi:MAG: hypothetical protein K0R34_1422 [Herbinix sp.]|jgi:hypothetical protein|nr:hypothetical protein [Herbinix sp.]